MGRLIEELDLRNKIRVFRGRAEAGKLLSEKLKHLASPDTIILAVPAGGVPVGYEIAKGNALLMDVLIVRKIQIPGNPEAGFGALGPDGEAIFNERLLRNLRLTEEELNRQIEKTKMVLEKRNRAYRGNRPFPDLKDKVVIVVDDGLASGYTMLEAVNFVKRKRTEKVIVAVPTASESSIDLLLPEVAEIYCLNIREFYPFAVAEAYMKWYDVGDEEVIALLRDLWNA
ncbi:MAG TPA: phosphoribosyltransferase [Nitrospiraceae bacterium]|nr:phosphoribosyltransferase [Nitrospiraceae bacterium]